jgi:dolichyl-phosphate beta-glucosyltransferase
MTPTAPALSVVLPCYRAAATAVETVGTLSGFLPTITDDWEIVVVDDGGNDFRATPLPGHPRLQLVSHPRNLGKGAAVRAGMRAARGRVRVFTDVDLPYDRELIPLMTEYIERSGFHLVIGDRSLPGSEYAETTSVSRRMLSRVASQFIGSIVTGGFFDTQCGIKAMRGDVADLLFPLVRTDGFAFDVEVVYLALKHRLDIKRVPVRLRRNDGSTVRPVRDAIRSTADLLSIKWRQTRGEYRSGGLEAIVRGEQDAERDRHRIPD